MTDLKKKEFLEILEPYINSEEVSKMKDYVAHGKISVFSHCLNVAKTAYDINNKFNLHSDLQTLLVGALLHDFYLYDWHDAKLNTNIFKMHGYTHPFKACENAIEVFDINEDIQKVIKTHMWPLTLRSFPNSKEAIIVCIADKICALKETVFRW